MQLNKKLILHTINSISSMIQVSSMNEKYIMINII